MNLLNETLFDDYEDDSEIVRCDNCTCDDKLNLSTKVTLVINGDRYISKIDKITDKYIIVENKRFPKPDHYSKHEIIKIKGIGDKGRYFRIWLNVEDPYLDPTF